jgi:hypothetical protein
MNPKSINDLDPKLKETYERVMGTSFAPTSSTPPTQNRPSMQTAAEQPTQQQPIIPADTQQTAPVPQAPAVNSMPEMVQSPQMPKMPDPFKEVPLPPTNVLIKNATITKKKNSLKSILFLFGGIIFFIVYGVVWAKVFGLF